MSLGATFSSTPKSFRIDTLVPASWPNAGIIGTSACSAGSTARTRTSESPSAEVASAGRSASRTRTPSRRVPLSEPQSWTRHPPSSRTRRQWKRDTAGSVSTRSFAPWVPMRQVSPSKRIVRDAAAPSSRSTVKESRGIATVSMNWRAVATLGSSRPRIEASAAIGDGVDGKNVDEDEGGAASAPSGGGGGSDGATGGGMELEDGDDRMAGLGGGAGGGIGRR